MSFLNRMMASIGIGSATVDTVLENARVRAGEPMRGVVRVRGGSVEQAVDAISLHLMTQYRREVNDRTVREAYRLGEIQVTSGFTLAPGESREFPFDVMLPDQTPATIGHTPVWLKTTVGISSAVDPTDKDYLEVLPHPHTQVVLDAVAQLGFRLRQVECEYSRRLGRNCPFIQQFEFVPTTQFRGALDELELIFYPHAGGVDVWMEVDRRARGFGGLLEAAFDADESRLHVEFEVQHLAEGPHGVARHLVEIIGRHAR